MKRFYIVDTLTKAKRVNNYFHALLGEHQPGYRADKWTDIRKHKTQSLYAVKLLEVDSIRWNNIKTKLPGEFDTSKVIKLDRMDTNYFTRNT